MATGRKVKKSWNEKLANSKDLPKIVKCEEKGKFKPRWGLKEGDTIVIPAPREVDAVMKKIKKGSLTTINQIRKILARKYQTTTACPITTGIFAWISAYAAEERKAKGDKKITPYWRTLKADGEINPKYPGGVEKQKEYLQTEGYHFQQKGKKWMVVDYQKFLPQMEQF
jgi:alkylated DNA nucleotide flippase Atl1